MNRRRKLIVALGGSTLGALALGLPISAIAQSQNKVWRIGFLTQRRVTANDSSYHDGFVRGLRDLGFEEGKNLVIELRSAEGDFTRLPALAAELVEMKLDLIAAAGTLGTRAAQQATSTIPIVMGSTNDPVADGFVKSLGRPGGNITGVANMGAEIGPKHLEMLVSMSPKLERVAVLLAPANPSHARILEMVRSAARKREIRIFPVEAQTRQGLDTAFSKMATEKVGAFIVAQDAFLVQYGPEIASAAAKQNLLSISAFSAYAEAGGLLSYGQNLAESWRRAATFVDKILKGRKPADLPVEQPTTLELVINRKTATTMGIKIPQSILVLADRVIE